MMNLTKIKNVDLKYTNDEKTKINDNSSLILMIYLNQLNILIILPNIVQN